MYLVLLNDLFLKERSKEDNNLYHFLRSDSKRSVVVIAKVTHNTLHPYQKVTRYNQAHLLRSGLDNFAYYPTHFLFLKFVLFLMRK